jgi:multiple antibiotic resistance protein
MHALILFAGTCLMGFFAIMNPIANTPVFIGLTNGLSDRAKKVAAAKSVTIAFVIIAVFCVLGQVIFKAFGITLPAFRITGGVLVFVIGMQMLHGHSSTVHAPTEEDEQAQEEEAMNIAVSPLAMPILAGPGAIATAMNFVADGSKPKLAITLATLAVMCAITYVLFRSGEKLVKRLGHNVMTVITRMMGLIIAVIGTQMFIFGVQGVVEMMR